MALGGPCAAMSISYNMIIDELMSSKLVYFPREMSRLFDGLVGPDGDCGDWNEGALLLLEDDQRRTLQKLSQRPGLHALCVLSDEEEALAELETSGRCLGVRDSRGLRFVAQRVQCLLQRVQQWEYALHELILKGCSYSELLDASDPILSCPIVMSGIGLQIVAYTSQRLPSEPLVVEALQRGYFDERATGHFRDEGMASLWESIHELTYVECETSQRHYPVVFYVFRIDEHHYLHFTVHLEDKIYSEGFRDMLQILVDAIDLHIRCNPPSKTLFDDSASAALSDLVTRRTKVNRRTLSVFAKAGLEAGSSYRLRVVDYGLLSGERQIAALKALDLASLGKSKVIVSLVDEHAVILESVSVAEGGGTSASPAASSFLSVLGAHLARRQAIAATSDAFCDFSDVPFAYQQCLAALKAAMAFDYPYGRSYSFVSTFVDFLLVRGDDDAEFIDACVDRCIVQRIIADDALSGTNDAAMLRTYLLQERHAKEASEILFVHRNTLAYRMDRLQKRYGFSIDDPATRLRMLIEFRLVDRKALQQREG